MRTSQGVFLRWEHFRWWESRTAKSGQEHIKAETFYAAVGFLPVSKSTWSKNLTVFTEISQTKFPHSHNTKTGKSVIYCSLTIYSGYNNSSRQISAYRYHRQTAFDVSKKDSGFLEWGKATKDPLRKRSWEKKQRWGTCTLKSISPKPCWIGLRLPCSSSQLQNFWPEIKILTFIFKFFHNVFHHLMVEGFPSLYDCDVQTVVDFLEFLRETEQNTYIKGTQWKPMANVY